MDMPMDSEDIQAKMVSPRVRQQVLPAELELEPSFPPKAGSFGEVLVFHHQQSCCDGEILPPTTWSRT